MDDVERQRIALLRQDARLRTATLAARLGVSRGTVGNRLRKLQDEQPITGSTGRLIKGIRHTETSVLLARCR